MTYRQQTDETVWAPTGDSAWTTPPGLATCTHGASGLGVLIDKAKPGEWLAVLELLTRYIGLPRPDADDHVTSPVAIRVNYVTPENRPRCDDWATAN